MLYLNKLRLFLLITTVCCSTLFSSEQTFLSNIRQITFPEMGFEKAGEAYFSPDEEMIIFQAVPPGKQHYQMYVMNLNESIPNMVSTGIGACTCGFFHPQGERVIFASSHDSPLTVEQDKPKQGKYTWDLTPYMNIYEANVDGSDLVPLTYGSSYHAECAYSPDGKEIVFASNESGTMNLYIMNADGTDIRKITDTDYSYNGGPFLSPDGKKVVFRSDRQYPDYLQIFTIDVDGRNETQLTNNTSVNWAPYWHPDSKHIIFTKSLGKHHRYELFIINSETGNEVRVTFNETFDGLPVFNRDGTKLMWTSKRGKNGTCQIFMADFNSENLRDES